MQSLVLRIGLVVALVAAALAPSARAQGDGVPDYVLLRTETDKWSHAPGETAKVVIELKIDPSVHVNAHVPTADYQFPTDIAWRDEAGLQIGEIKWPKPELKAFEFTDGEKIAVLEGKVKIVVPVTIPAGTKIGTVKLAGKLGAQGCTHTTCYAPQYDEFEVAINVEEGAASAAAAGDAPTAAPPATTAPVKATAQAPPAGTTETIPEDTIPETTIVEEGPEEVVPPAAAANPDGDGKPAFDCPVATSPTTHRAPFLLVLLTFGSGLLLAFTPCVLPLVPITIGIFSRQQATGGKPIVPALLYVLGLALTYAVLGTFAALSGSLFGAALQSTWVLVGISAMLFALALSMFGVWNFDIPAGLRNRIGGFRSGPIGPMLMGAAMGIVAAPCVGPFVVSLLTYVAELGSRMPTGQAAAIGGGLFFVLACGLGTPFFLVALGSGSIRPGEWMDTVKRVFGFLILVAVLWFLRPLISTLHPNAFLFGCLLLLVAATVYFFVTAKGPQHGPRLQVAHRVLGALALVGTIVMIAVLTKMPAAHAEGGDDGFVAYSDQAVEDAKAAGKPVVIDFGAEWCVACKELEHQTFPDPAVVIAGKGFVLLRADLTKAEDPAVVALSKRYSIKGLPTIVFLDPSGKEIEGLRLTGFEKPDAYALRLKCAGSVVVASVQ